VGYVKVFLLVGCLKMMLNYLRGTSKIFKLIRTYPKMSVVTGLVLASPLINHYMKVRADGLLKSPVYSKLLNGSRPAIPLDKANELKPVLRPDIAKELMETFFLRKTIAQRFGVVVGPSGSGKTTIISELCNKSPSGVLYLEIDSPEGLAEVLSNEIELKTAPSNLFDLMLGYISDKYIHYVGLPQSEVKALKKVFDVLEDVSEMYYKEVGEIPMLVIDGVDMLAKHDPKLCCQLITHAKVLANMKKLTIVLVSSEGSIMPLVKKLSATNRSIICEVGDIDTDDALRFLTENGVGVTLAKKIVDYISGRLIYLESSIYLNEKIKWKGEEVVFKELNDRFFANILSFQKAIVKAESPISIALLKKVSEMGSVDVADLLTDDSDKERYCEVLLKLVQANIFRYDTKGA